MADQENKDIGQDGVNQIPAIIQSQQPVAQQPTATNISIISPEAIKYKIIMYVMIVVLFFVLVGSGAGLYYMWTHPTVQYEKQVNVEDPKKEKQLAADAGTKISDSQAERASEKMKDIYANDTKPDKVIDTNGKDYKNEVDKTSKDAKADQTVVVDRNNPDKKPDPKKDDKVELNVYNNKFYPDKQWGVTYYNDSSIAIDYNERLKLFGTTVYIGPAIMYDNKDKDFKYGVRMTIPF